MSRKLVHKRPAPDPSGTVPTLSFTFLRMFTVAANGSVGVAAAFVLSILGMVGIVTLIIVGKHLSVTFSGLGKLIDP